MNTLTVTTPVLLPYFGVYASVVASIGVIIVVFGLARGKSFWFKYTGLGIAVAGFFGFCGFGSITSNFPETIRASVTEAWAAEIAEGVNYVEFRQPGSYAAIRDNQPCILRVYETQQPFITDKVSWEAELVCNGEKVPVNTVPGQ